jgi:hypothetical protein
LRRWYVFTTHRKRISTNTQLELSLRITIDEAGTRHVS